MIRITQEYVGKGHACSKVAWGGYVAADRDAVLYNSWTMISNLFDILNLFCGYGQSVVFHL